MKLCNFGWTTATEQTGASHQPFFQISCVKLSLGTFQRRRTQQEIVRDGEMSQDIQAGSGCRNHAFLFTDQPFKIFVVFPTRRLRCVGHLLYILRYLHHLFRGLFLWTLSCCILILAHSDIFWTFLLAGKVSGGTASEIWVLISPKGQSSVHVLQQLESQQTHLVF